MFVWFKKVVSGGEANNRGRPDDLCCANISGSEPLKSQVWAAVWREAPGYYHRGTTFSTPAHLAALDNVFNYTVNYRRDADISFTYFEQSSRQCRWKEVEVCAIVFTISATYLGLAGVLFSCGKRVAVFKVRPCPLDLISLLH